MSTCYPNVSMPDDRLCLTFPPGHTVGLLVKTELAMIGGSFWKPPTPECSSIIAQGSWPTLFLHKGLPPYLWIAFYNLESFINFTSK